MSEQPVPVPADDGEGIFENQGSATDLKAPGPQQAYMDPSGNFVPQPIGQAPTPPGTIHQVESPEQIAANIFASQQGKPLQLNVPWVMSIPDEATRNFFINLVNLFNAHYGRVTPTS